MLRGTVSGRVVEDEVVGRGIGRGAVMVLRRVSGADVSVMMSSLVVVVLVSLPPSFGWWAGFRL